MKYLIKIWLFAVLLMTSCSHENGSSTFLYEKDQAKEAPSNPRNPYDFVGENYLRLTQEQPVIIASRTVNALKGSNIRQSSISQNDSTVYTIETLWDLIDQSQLSLPAREALMNFITIVLEFEIGDYDAFYVYITDYETQVLNDAVLTNEDKRVILSFTSIVRFAAFEGTPMSTQSEDEDDDEEEEDDDWDLSIPAIADWLLIVLNDQSL